MSVCSCQARNTQHEPAAAATETASTEAHLLTGADRTDAYLPMLEGRRVAMLVNQTSVIAHDGGHTAIVDSLISRDVDVRFLMAPEHGIKGLISAGDPVTDSHYQQKQNLKVYSLYGKNKKPQAEWLSQCDVVVFDVQDVGCRFYTYLSSLYYLLQACGEQHKEVIVLDRPNPNDTIDGPVLSDDRFRSFVGMVNVPMLHGCTLGEMAQMMVGEGWLGDCPKPKLTVITCQGWHHGQPYDLPIAPSPNLRTPHAIRLYPSLCLYEASDVSVGRGTDTPFEVVGKPGFAKGDYRFTPQPCEAATNPPHAGKLCQGYDLRTLDVSVGLHLDLLLLFADTEWITQTKFFDRLAGTDQLRLMITQGRPEDEIRQSWQPDLLKYRAMREKYVLY
ncbi:MAG: DUF1343 domain-containing protein [Bacteroidales bacterium]|nr:DUF1343 domain-containing protein [Candidatus Liminaster caballi]